MWLKVTIFFPRLRTASLISAETRPLSAETKTPSAEMEKSRASALKDGVTKHGSPGPIGRGYLFEVHREVGASEAAEN